MEKSSKQFLPERYAETENVPLPDHVVAGSMFYFRKHDEGEGESRKRKRLR